MNPKINRDSAVTRESTVQILAMEDSELRIASLLPAATDICIELGLEAKLVGITHECSKPKAVVEILTSTTLMATAAQDDIHKAVQETIGTSSLYPIVPDAWERANPNLVLTQDLCSVCGPTPSDVCNLDGRVRTISLSPTNLDQVAESFLEVAKACNQSERGMELKERFWRQIRQIQQLAKPSSPLQKVFLLEWLDPPFDGGHWIPDMIRFAGLEPALTKTETKSAVVEWDAIHKAKPDVLLVACCGMDLQRNISDAQKYWKPHLERLAANGTQIFAADGNKYFARPGPYLAGGVAILAQCAMHHDKEVMKAMTEMDFCPKLGEGWEKIVVGNDIADVEDIGSYMALHDEACRKGEFHYIDPETEYQVFTELAHKDRGWCCGAGCRHCPFSHANVKNKAAKIKQPAFLHQQPDSGNPIKVLFHSGGKDSFLTLRALVRSTEKCEIVLLTTFDATSRIIAHQNVKIHDIQRQAEHLQITLLGIPLHRGSGEKYVSRIRRGIDVIENAYGRPVDALVFGDLHLEHIRSWREDQIGALGYKREYPLWQVSYEDLMKDLEASRVPCVVSASTVDSVEVGTRFTRDFYSSLVSGAQIDGFGERGEFHSLAQVWEVDSAVALGSTDSDGK